MRVAKSSDWRGEEPSPRPYTFIAPPLPNHRFAFTATHF